VPKKTMIIFSFFLFFFFFFCFKKQKKYLNYLPNEHNNVIWVMYFSANGYFSGRNLMNLLLIFNMTKRRLDFFYKCPILQFSVRVKILILGGLPVIDSSFFFVIPQILGVLGPPVTQSLQSRMISHN